MDTTVAFPQVPTKLGRVTIKRYTILQETKGIGGVQKNTTDNDAWDGYIIMYHYHTKEAKAVIDPGLSLRILMEVDCCLQLIMMSRKVAVYAVVVAVDLQISSPPNTSN